MIKKRVKRNSRYQPCAELNTKNSSRWQLVRRIISYIDPLLECLLMPTLQILENYNSLYHTQPSPPPQPTGNFLINYFLIIFLFLNSRAHFRDLYHGHQIQICRKIALYFLVLMQIPRSIMSRIKTRQSNKLCGWKFIADIYRRYYLKQTKIFGRIGRILCYIFCRL